jgi:nitroreductase
MSNPALKTIELNIIEYDTADMQQQAADFYDAMRTRRSIRDFSAKPVPIEIIKNCIRTAGSAPSGANRQPWHFAVVTSAAIKKQIREGAELEEQEFYSTRAPLDWLEALAPLGTDAQKPFLETAPCLIVIFGQKYAQDANGKKQKNYYVTESVSIATGLLIAALHHAGLSTLTHTPSPMKFLNKILERPDTEKPLMILVAGYAARHVRVPDITRKSLEQISSYHK